MLRICIYLIVGFFFINFSDVFAGDFLDAELNFPSVLGKRKEPTIAYMLDYYKCNKEERDEKDGSTALMRAASKGYIEALNCFLIFSPDLNACDFCGRTALIWAVRAGQREAVNILLKQGADVNIRDVYNNDALRIALYHNHLEFIHPFFLKSTFANKALNFVMILEYKKQEVVEILKNCGMHIDIVIDQKDGTTFLIKAIKKRSSRFLDLFLRNGANVDRADYYKNTPLMIAAQNGYEEAVHKLLKFRANINLTNYQGKKAIDFAATESICSLIGNSNLIPKI